MFMCAESSVNQVRQHQESTELQYRLVDRAIGLGWPRERVRVIDEDLGKSGAASAERHGFQRLIAEIGLGNAGLVLSLDASRLARNNRDWHQLLELCSLFGGLILADGERLYDPGAYHDRLLLGLSGIMSEAELHQIRLRLHQGEYQKAARGELRVPLPAGLAYDRAGAIVRNPDEEVQARLQLVFAKFTELGSARGVMRYLRANDLPLPVRPLHGPVPHEVLWRDADSARVHQILHNPAYAGAYVYGRRRADPVRRHSGGAALRRRPRSQPRRMGGLPAGGASRLHLLGAVHGQPAAPGGQHQPLRGRPYGCPASGQRAAAGHCRMRALRAAHEPALHRPEGRLSGLLLPRRPRPARPCPLCQEVRALAIDAFVERMFLDALAPDQDRHRRCCSRGSWGSRKRTPELEKQWALRRERARYEAERARRQYDAVEPENRLVARSLERAWEEKLRAVETVKQEYERWRPRGAACLERGRSGRATSLYGEGENLPRIWHAATTTAAERKQLLRFIVREVVLDQKRAPGRGAQDCVADRRDQRALRAAARPHLPRLPRPRAATPARRGPDNGAGKMDKEIATALNREGFVAARGCTFKGENVWLLRKRWGIATVKINGVSANPPRWPDGTYSIQGAAAALGITPQTVFDYLARGLLSGRQRAKGQPWQIDLCEEQIIQLRARLRHTRRWRKEAL